MDICNEINLNLIFSISILQPTAQAVCHAHSSELKVSVRDMRIRLIPALEDNYMYLLIDDKTNKCAVIDPVEPKKVM